MVVLPCSDQIVPYSIEAAAEFPTLQCGFRDLLRLYHVTVILPAQRGSLWTMEALAGYGTDSDDSDHSHVERRPSPTTTMKTSSGISGLFGLLPDDDDDDNHDDDDDNDDERGGEVGPTTTTSTRLGDDDVDEMCACTEVEVGGVNVVTNDGGGESGGKRRRKR